LGSWMGMAQGGKWKGKPIGPFNNWGKFWKLNGGKVLIPETRKIPANFKRPFWGERF